MAETVTSVAVFVNFYLFLMITEFTNMDIIRLINRMQNINNNFVNITREEVEYMTKKANANNLSEIEAVDLILDYGLA